MKLLVLVDVQNVYHGARSYTNDLGKIDYDLLVRRIVARIQEDPGFHWLDLDGVPIPIAPCVDTTVFGYVVNTPRNKGLSLFAFLKRIGYILRVKNYPEGIAEDAEWRGTVSAMMQMDFIEHAASYDAVVVVSGSGVFAPAFKAAKRNWPRVKCIIAAFKTTMHGTYERNTKLADKLMYLDDDVLKVEG
jgi:hypothetical protein